MGIGFGRRRRTLSGGFFSWNSEIPGYYVGRTACRKNLWEENMMGQMGKWAFIVGFVICVVAGLLIAEPWMYWVLAVLGLPFARSC
jgi:hypothetical protein